MKPNQGHLPDVEQLAIEGSGELADYYPKTAAGVMEVYEDHLYYGRNVIWDGHAGNMIRADPEYLQHIWGNIFDPDKLAAIVSGIAEADDRLVFTAPYGTASRIDLQAIEESQEYWEDEGLDRAYTTGDEELDRYLADPSDVLDEYGDEGDDERAEAEADIQERLTEAVARGEGDLGQWVVTIRDGNHRAFGALLAGEPYVWVILEQNQHQDLEQSAMKGTLSDEQQELLSMLE